MNEEKKSLDQGDIALGMVVIGFVGMILSALLIGLLGIGSIVLLVISILSIIIGFIMTMMEKSKDNAAHIANINAFQEEYDKYVDKMGIVKSDTQVTLWETDEDDFELDIPQYLWIANGMLNIFPMSKYYKEYPEFVKLRFCRCQQYQ